MQLLTSVVFFQELPEGNWFCCSGCENINTTLVNLVARGEENLPNPLLSLIKKKYNNKGLEFGSNIRIKWRLLNWKVGESEENGFVDDGWLLMGTDGVKAWTFF